MNIALTRKHQGNTEYLVYSVRRTGAGHAVRSKKVQSNGKLLGMLTEDKNTEKEARDRIKTMIHVKLKKQDWTPVDLVQLPKEVVKFLEVPPEMQVTPEEMLMILKKAHDERYVYFTNVNGLEEFFDIGVEYLGYKTDDDKTLKVFDRYGTLRECFIHRMKLIEPTERALEAGFKIGEKNEVAVGVV